MKLGRCPVCHSHIHLDQLVQDDAGRELLATLVSMDAELGRWAVLYIGLWRPAKSDLSNARAARLLRETLALCTDSVRLSIALQTTVTALQKKRIAGENMAALDSHTYLKRVLDTTIVLPPPEEEPPPAPPSTMEEVKIEHTAQDRPPATQLPVLKNYKPPTAVGPDARPPTKEELQKVQDLLKHAKQSMTTKT